MAGFFRKRSLKADDKRTNVSDLTLRESLLPLCLVTVLFFLWGFAYGLLDVLNKHFQTSLGVSRARSAGLQASYFGAYPVASLTFAGWVLRRYGYRATFMLGLSLYGVGALLFWPAAAKRSFGGFCGATFIIGTGLGSLESAANPYLAVCGPPKYSELRLNIAQAVQAVGTVVGPVLASQVFFKNTSENDLSSVQWVYLGIAIFVFSLATVFYFANIPEVTDADMQLQAQDVGAYNETKPLSRQWMLWWAALSEFTYTGAQVAIAGYFVNYVTEVRKGTTSAMGSNFLAIAQGCFTIGRFSGAAMMSKVKPRKVLFVYFSMVVVFMAMTTGARGNAGLAALSITLFFESICFPTTFTLGIRGLGKLTKKGSSIIVGGISGGALVPPLLGLAADAFDDTGRAMFVPLIFFVVGWSFPVVVNFYPKWRDVIDGFHESKLGVDRTAKDVEAAIAGTTRPENEKTHEVELVERLGEEHAVTTKLPGL